MKCLMTVVAFSLFAYCFGSKLIDDSQSPVTSQKEKTSVQQQFENIDQGSSNKFIDTVDIVAYPRATSLDGRHIISFPKNDDDTYRFFTFSTENIHHDHTLNNAPNVASDPSARAESYGVDDAPYYVDDLQDPYTYNTVVNDKADDDLNFHGTYLDYDSYVNSKNHYDVSNNDISYYEMLKDMSKHNVNCDEFLDDNIEDSPTKMNPFPMMAAQEKANYNKLRMIEDPIDASKTNPSSDTNPIFNPNSDIKIKTRRLLSSEFPENVRERKLIKSKKTKKEKKKLITSDTKILQNSIYTEASLAAKPIQNFDLNLSLNPSPKFDTIHNSEGFNFSFAG
jgi:hypothetical protein